MSSIPSTISEVKYISTFINLDTHAGYKFLETDEGIVPYPVGIIEDAFERLLYTPSEMPGEDLAVHSYRFVYRKGDGNRISVPVAEVEGVTMVGGIPQEFRVILADPPEVPEDEALRDAPPFVRIMRAVCPGEINEAHLQALRLRVLAEANPREAATPEIPLPAPRHDNVVKMWAVGKRPVRHDRPPKDVMKYARTMPYKGNWERVFFWLYSKSKYQPCNTVPRYVGTSGRMGRFYYLGNAELVRLTKLSERAVKLQLAWLKKNRFIHECKRGNPDRGCSVWELPLNMAHAFKWKRKHKKAPAGRGPGPGKTSDGQGTLEPPITAAGRAVLRKLFEGVPDHKP